MNLFADHYFYIGQAHHTAGKPCQDHALSWSHGDIACAVVSDGCSTGGNTDMGSRILTFATRQAIHDHAQASHGSFDTAAASIRARQYQLMATVRPTLGLEKGDMLATCLCVYCTQEGGLVYSQGDGVVAFKYRDGRIKMRRYDWTGNMPFYPSYEGVELTLFMKTHEADPEGASLATTYATIDQYGNHESGEMGSVLGVSLGCGMEGVSIPIDTELASELEFIAIFSDGVTQVEGVDWRDAVKELLAFKNASGEFAKRRMIRAIRDWQLTGKGPVDDISYGVVRIASA